MMLWETMAAALVGLAVVALIIGPLMGQGNPAPPTVDEPEDLEETPKGVALTALREIEFDRATGKLSDEDYQALKAKYTAEALALLRAEEAGKAEGANRAGQAGDSGLGATASELPAAASEAADPVEALVADRVRQLQTGMVRCPGCGPRPEGDALFCSTCGRSLTLGGCLDCGAPLVPGSRFCENCGVAVAR
jgi:Double zinc ribbon